MGDMIQRLIEVAEQYFDCHHGEQKAFFEWPQRDGESLRFIYASYVIRGDDLKELEQWMIDSVLLPLFEATDGQGMLYWRLNECFQVGITERAGSVDYTLRTRIVVVDKDLKAIRLEDVIKGEGMPAKVITTKNTFDAVREGLIDEPIGPDKMVILH